jgi:hypothetical protein
MSELDSSVSEPQKEENKWQEHYIGMPEYNNVVQDEPLITATFKFKTQEDFDEFNRLLKLHIYDGQRVFDGMQRKDKKNAWYPLKTKASKYKYV